MTASSLQDELERHGLRAMLPLGIHPNRSVLTSLLERDPALASASFEYGNELIMDTEIVLPSLKGEPHARARAVVEDRLHSIPRQFAQPIAAFLGIKLRPAALK